ncbi:S8 family serine peptidase [Fibrella forsythiae]|uniref:S8 family peptidase n=1 Tax=Fibrella forsythiae TaxID=2817061 RepID=A0ABS3JFN4_9BACT|nr:S8 family serine peptidase [Fibrella forsythiae]MBO0948818.1 S8 family peptidase [Fibrella forsythiae]
MIISFIVVSPIRAQLASYTTVRPTHVQRPASSTKPVGRSRPLAFGRNKTYASHRATLDLGLDATGHPVVYGLTNTEAAQGTRTQALYGLNATGLFLNGGTRFVSGKLGLWDGGQVLTTHREFGGRVSMRNAGTSLSNHATHMAGTLVAAGITPEARGMAYGASLAVWDYANDIAELTVSAADLLVSVHAYGPLSGWVQNLERPGNDPNKKWEWWGNTTISSTEDYLFGFYSTKARDIDRLLYTNPSLLMVRSADNKRAETGPTANTPYFLNSTDQQSTVVRSRNDAYDVIPGEANAKNVLTVGAAEVSLDSDNDPTRLLVSPYSGWGPTDDGRIKPDLLGVGTGVYSTLADGTAAYGTNTGTSMAAANVAGSLLLIQELYARQTNGKFLRSATVKGLAIHTADRLIPEKGPDYRQGWGLLNTEAAAAVVQNANQAHLINESTLAQGQTWTTSVIAQGGEPLVVTLCWTDPEGSVSPLTPSSLNNRTPKLVNDLDLRVLAGSTTSLPFVLNPALPVNAATTAGNSRDNVEQIYIANPVAGQTYTIRVNHKGTLLAGIQPFSVLASGRRHVKCTLPGMTLLAKADTTICEGSVLNLRSDDVPGVRYEWLRDGIQILEANTPECPIQEAGAYTLRYTDRNGCTGLSTPVRVNVFSPTVQVSPSAVRQYLCAEQSTVRLIANAGNGTALSWLRNGVQITSGMASSTLVVSQEGTYQAQIIRNGCTGRSAAVEVQVSGVNTITVLPADELLQLPVGASLSLQAAVGKEFQYQWFRDKQVIDNATQSTLVVKQPGTYQVRVNQQQCVGWSAEKVVRHSAWTGDSVADSLLTFGSDDSTFVAYPNPVLTTLLIRYLQPGASQVHVDVYSAAGHLEKAGFMLNHLSNGLFTLDLHVGDLPIGLYMLHLTDGPRQRSLRFLRR